MSYKLFEEVMKNGLALMVSFTILLILSLIFNIVLAYPMMLAWNIVMVKLGFPALTYFEMFLLQFLLVSLWKHSTSIVKT